MLPQRTFLEIISGQKQGLPAAAARGLLAAMEPFYAWYVGRRNRGYDSGRLAATNFDAPIISVGNLTVGGTGKTPLVCWLASWLGSRGIDVTLVSRGYGRRRQQSNDEAQELAQRLGDVPHVQHADRVQAARKALSRNRRQVLILDDAFQHRRIARDLDIVLIDALAPFGYGRLLPRGLLREPLESLRRADVVGLSRSDCVDAERRRQIRRQVEHYAPQALWIELAHRPVALLDFHGTALPLETVRSRSVLAFCGIGNPAGFSHTLAAAGAKVLARRDFPDHHSYSTRDIDALARWAAAHREASAILCTHKDLVKVRRERIGPLPLWAVAVDLEILSGQLQLADRLNEICLKLAADDPQRCGNAA